jgi:hypothetical protein
MSIRTLRAAIPGFLAALMFMLMPRASQAQSLADLARQERAKKASKTTKEYTNDDIPQATLSSAPATKPDAAKEGAAKPEDAAKKGGEEEKKPEEVEKEYRDKAAKLKENLDMEARRLDVMQRELNLTQQQYYSDPNVALREQYSREDINKRTEEITKQQEAVDKAKQAISDLEDELRKKNLPPGWARP